jgi:hypothetical protein
VGEGGTDSRGHSGIASPDLLLENLHVDNRSRATGFVGKSSEVQWLRTLFCVEHVEDNREEAYISGPRASFETSANSQQVSALTFYLDHEHVDLGYEVAAYDLPPRETAERLLVVYMNTVHDSFPILPKQEFEDECRRFFQASGHARPMLVGPKWRAILNLVFAIGDRHLDVMQEEWRMDEYDHLVYQARARNLAWNEATISQHPDLHQIQVAGLLAFYLLSVGQVSRYVMLNEPMCNN